MRLTSTAGDRGLMHTTSSLLGARASVLQVKSVASHLQASTPRSTVSLAASMVPAPNCVLLMEKSATRLISMEIFRESLTMTKSPSMSFTTWHSMMVPVVSFHRALSATRLLLTS